MTHTKASTTLTAPPSIKEERVHARKLAHLERACERASTTLTVPPSIKEERKRALKHAQGERKRARGTDL